MTLFSMFSPQDLVLACAITFLAGCVKGMVGFAMPVILLSGLSTVLPPEVALAGLILPTLVTNAMQALREGATAAIGSIRRFRVFLVVGLVFLLVGSQFVTRIPAPTFLLLIGGLVVGFVLFQMLGLGGSLQQASVRTEIAAGALAGFLGGISGVWGPPTVAYLTALNTAKRDQMRIQGVIYGLGAVALAVAHLGSGILHAQTIPFSMLLIAPAVSGMWLGLRLQDRIDQATFRKATLLVLFIAGLNLLRRSLLG